MQSMSNTIDFLLMMITLLLLVYCKVSIEINLKGVENLRTTYEMHTQPTLTTNFNNQLFQLNDDLTTYLLYDILKNEL